MILIVIAAAIGALITHNFGWVAMAIYVAILFTSIFVEGFMRGVWQEEGPPWTR